MKRLGAAALLLGALLTGCGEDTAPAQDSFLLTTALPTPATPGTEVTVYGRLPSSVTTIRLGERSLPGTPVRDGVRVKLPEDLLAGLYTVTVPGVEGSSVPLDVVPRLDSVTLTGDVVQAKGAGWGADPGLAVIEVNGQRLSTTGDAGTLRATVNNNLPNGNGTASDLYGAFNVRVIVGERASQTQPIRKDAASVTGTVTRPLNGASLKPQAAPVPRGTVPSPVLLVPEGQPVPPAGLLQQVHLPSLRVIRATYRDPQTAQGAQTLLARQGVSAELDRPVAVQDTRKVDVPLTGLRSQAVNARQWFWPMLGVTEAWTRTRGAGVTVAVVDTGVNLNHPDLKANLLSGRDYVDGDRTPSDSSGHGTHVSGLIAANGSVMGAAPAARLLPVRVIGPEGGTTSDLARGLLWAAGLDESDPNPTPAQVINLSLGTPEYSEILTEAVNRVLNAGVIVVAASGNDGGLPYAPANIPGVIAVTSIGGPVTLYQPSYANRGPGTRLAAYGGDLNADQDNNGERDGILSTDLNADGTPGYALRQGTSMAAPEVSGIAALLLAQGTPARAVKSLLEGHATDIGVAGMDLNTGWGLVNAAPVRADQPATYVLALDPQGHVVTYVRTVGDSFTLHSLPPNVPVQLVAATDLDGDGIVAEAGELTSTPVNVTLKPGEKGTGSLTLTPSNGEQALTLPK
ncbi:S8 family serine peptidase [Deinococcus metallilatus]|uniref:Subtilisin family serine protease n=1 Tax=Deinococcus metallilatus TaxID=1211322 RepID=A0ABR6N1H9_9DEIO|nr:S8 family serine peptidase [Deinococcus metallilatus]MBB5297475.1 subtilisin family serine protease [Deinococcus metallilatus]GMA14377.1 hypothetical protein GCM10025871_07080 [Deinococcus metallilatus]